MSLLGQKSSLRGHKSALCHDRISKNTKTKRSFTLAVQTDHCHSIYNSHQINLPYSFLLTPYAVSSGICLDKKKALKRAQYVSSRINKAGGEDISRETLIFLLHTFIPFQAISTIIQTGPCDKCFICWLIVDDRK